MVENSLPLAIVWIAVFGITFCLSFSCVGLIRKLALTRKILDVPNERSSHSSPVPRGGGVAISLSLVFGMLVFQLLKPGFLSAPWFLAMFFGGVGVTLLGWLDDCYSLSAIVRFSVHLGAGGWAVYWLLPSRTNIEILFGVLWIAWSINFYNFMDGIDGLAASHAVLCGGAGALILLLCGKSCSAAIAGLVSFASAGFLLWNWPPARIFMGDSGSGFLGFAFGCFSVANGWGINGGFITWLILFGLFLLDTISTLLRRLARGERFWEAHNSHYYQIAVRGGMSHLRITCLYLVGTAILSGIAICLSL